VTEQGLVLEEARVRGNGAGMEVPDGAWLEMAVGITGANCRLCNPCAWGAHRRLAITSCVLMASVTP